MDDKLHKPSPLTAENISLKVKELAFEALFKNLPVAFYWMDRNGYQLGCNEIELKLVNIPSYDQFIGKHSTEISHPSAWENSKVVMETNQTMSTEEVHLKENGEVEHFLSIKSPINDTNGECIGLIGIAIDITQRKKMEEAARIAKEKAEAADQAKMQFLAVASHELRIPLTGILGLVGFLKEGGLQPAEEQEFLDHINSCSTHLLSIVNDILDFAKLEAEKYHLTLLPIDLKELIEEVAAMLTAQAKNKNLDLLVSYDPKAPHNIRGDSRALRQILINLVSNAIKFTEQGYVLIRVNCPEKSAESALLEIVVEDSGRGIPHDKLEMIFDKFSQVDDVYIRSTSKGGTGLGLAIVKKLVSLMDGVISVKSEVGKGSNFIFTADFALQTKFTTESTWQAHAAKVKVLIVDDTLRGEVLRTNLDTANCNVVTSSEAINELISSHQLGHPYQIMIVDQQLRDVDPAVLLQKIQKHKNIPELLAVLLIAHSSQLEKTKAMKAGFFEVITKPTQPIAFQVALTSAWERWAELHSQTEKTARRKVLLVEDDEIVQLVHTRLLNTMNCQVDRATTGNAALKLFSHNDYSVAFVDVGLSDMAGYHLIKQIRESSNIPIIALTGYTSDDEKDACLAAGANEVINKPVVPEVLQQLLVRYEFAS